MGLFLPQGIGIDLALKYKVYIGSMRSSGTFTASRLAKISGVGVGTIRFYERKGLLPKPKRRSSGYREYSLDDVKRIQFIKRAQELGFTLGEVKELLELRIVATGTCANVKQRTLDKLNEVSTKIKDLKRMEKVLKRLTSTCDGSSRSTSECPILKAFEKGVACA